MIFSEISPRFSAGFWPPRFLDLGEISPRFRNLGDQNPAEIWPRFLNLDGQNPTEILSAAKIMPRSLEISAAKILPRISPRLLNLGGQNSAQNLAEIPKSQRPKSCRESHAENILPWTLLFFK